MKWKKVWSLICTVGLPWGIVTAGSGIYLKHWHIVNHPRQHKVKLESIEDVKAILLCSVCVMGWILFKNLQHKRSGKDVGLCTWIGKVKEVPPDISPELKKAQYPDVEPEYLSKVPDQLPLGKQAGMYVQFDLSQYLSFLIFGSPGAGKSTLILTMLVYQLHRKLKEGETRPALFVFDFKNGELYRKSCFPGQKNVKFISLEGRTDWGWDPYYRLHDNPTDDDIIRELTLIANVLIENSNEKNTFFTDSAKVILIFVGLADFRMGRSFLQTIDHITSGDIKTMLEQVMDMTENRPDLTKVRDAISEYVGKDDNEALNNIKMTVKQKTSVFLVEDIRWAIEFSEKKASPYDLEEGTSLFFYPGDVDVTDTMMKIIAKQLEYHCRHRDFLNLKGEGELNQIVVVADECYTIGGLVDWTKWCSVARGFHTNIIMIWQSYSQIKELKNENYAESLMDDVDGTCILAVNSAKNCSEFLDFAGEYFEEKRSYNEGGTNSGSYSRSYERRMVLTKKDFLQLKKKKECILFMDGGYYKVQSEPARIYKNKELYTISQKCLAAHQAALRKDR